MPNYQQRISELDRKITHIEEERTTLLRVIGERVASSAPEGSMEGELSTALSRYTSITTEIERVSTTVERMLDLDQKQIEIKARMKECQVEQEKLFSTMDKVYTRIGEVAFDIFRRRPVVDATYAELFRELSHHHDQLRALRQESIRLESLEGSNPTGWWRKVVTKGQRAWGDHRQGVKERQLSRLYQIAGRKVVHSEFVQTYGTEELIRVGAPFSIATERDHQLTAEIEQLRGRSGELLSEFNSLSGGKKLAEARKSSSLEIEHQRTQLHEVFVAIAHGVLEDPPTFVAKEAAQVREISTRIDSLHTLRTRVEAGLHAHEGEKLAARIGEKITSLDEKIAELTHQREQEEELLRQKREEITTLLTTRGEESELFEA